MAVNRIIAVGNLKGGTGKSTIAVNLACRLAEHSRSVVLVDADPQGTAAAWLRKGTPPGLGIGAWPLGHAASPEAWRAEIATLRARYERTVIDLPPQTGESFEAALRVADLLIVPLTLSEVDLHATALALAVLQRIRGVRAGRPSCLLVPSKVDRRTALGRRASASLARLGCEVGPALGQRAAHAEAFRTASWIGAHAPGSAAHEEICALVQQVEVQLRRCEEPEAFAPESDAAATADVAAEAATQRAPAKIGTLLLHFVAAWSAGPRRAERPALLRSMLPILSARRRGAGATPLQGRMP